MECNKVFVLEKIEYLRLFNKRTKEYEIDHSVTSIINIYKSEDKARSDRRELINKESNIKTKYCVSSFILK